MPEDKYKTSTQTQVPDATRCSEMDETGWGMWMVGSGTLGLSEVSQSTWKSGVAIGPFLLPRQSVVPNVKLGIVLMIRNFARALEIMVAPSRVVMGSNWGLDLNPGSAVCQLCDLGQVINHSVSMSSHYKCG